MSKIYLSALLLIVTMHLQGQQQGIIQQIEDTQTEHKSLIPIHDGDIVIIRTDLLYQGGGKKPILSNILKTLGVAVATYQSGKLISGASKFGESPGNTNWLLPLGGTLVLGANKISAKKSQPFSIKYTHYNNDMIEDLTEIIRVDKKIIKSQKPVSRIVNQDGFVKIELFQSGKPYSFKNFIEIVPSLKKEIEITDKTLQPLYIPSTRFVADIVNIDRLPRIMTPPQLISNEFVNSLILEKVGKSSKINNLRRKLVAAPLIPSSHNFIAKMSFRGINSTVSMKAANKKLPSRKMPFRYALPEFILPRRRFVIPFEDDNSDASTNDDEHGQESSPEKHVDSVPGVGGFGYGSGGDAVVFSSPHWSSSRSAATYGGSGSGGGSWDNSGNHYEPYNPCDEYNPTSECYDYCSINPSDDVCCDKTDQYSECYVNCPSGSTPTGSLLVDAKSFSKFLDGIVPSDAVSQSIYLSSYTDVDGIQHYQLSGAYTDASYQVTTFSSFDIGTVPSLATWGGWLQSDPNFNQVGSTISYTGGTITNYHYGDGSGIGKYAVWTPTSGPAIVLPNVNVVDTGVTSGTGMTLPDASDFGWTATIHLSTTGSTIEELEHEFGHFIQSQIIGLLSYGKVMASSFFSATFNPSEHNKYWTETAANAYSKLFFGSSSAIGGSTHYDSKSCQ